MTTEIARMTLNGVTVRVTHDADAYELDTTGTPVAIFPYRVEIRRPGNAFGKFETIDRLTDMGYAIRKAADVFTIETATY